MESDTFVFVLSRQVCVATITKIAGRLMRVRLESFEEELEQWMDVFSPDIYPVGWCQTFGHPLEAPRPKSHSLNIFLFDDIRTS